MSEGSSIDYVRLREKVVDTELRFAPSTEDCVAIALSSGPIGTLLRTNIIKLKINNIRIIKKIEKLTSMLVPLIKKYDDHVLEQALKTLTILTWCYYGQTSEVPDYNFVVSRTSAFSDLEEDISMSTQQQSWCATLRHYDNFSVDEFDLQIASLVENGYLDEEGLRTEASMLNERVLSARSEDSFQEAWRKFHESFADNSQEVIDCLSDSFKNNARYISPVNLDGTVRLLRYLGKDKLASKIITLYIDKRQSDSELFNLDTSVLPGQIKDQEVIERFRQKYESLRSTRTMLEICDFLLENESHQDEEEILLSQASIQEYLDLLSLRGDRNYLNMLIFV